MLNVHSAFSADVFVGRHLFVKLVFLVAACTFKLSLRNHTYLWAFI